MISFRFIGACLKTQWQPSGAGSWATGGKKMLTRRRNTSAKVVSELRCPKKYVCFPMILLSSNVSHLYLMQTCFFVFPKVSTYFLGSSSSKSPSGQLQPCCVFISIGEDEVAPFPLLPQPTKHYLELLRLGNIL